MIAFDKLQSVGKALMLPVAMLPVAAILLRFGVNIMLLVAIDGIIGFFLLRDKKYE